MKSNYVISSRIIIDREEIKNCYFQINIEQKVAGHDTFEIICPKDALEEKGSYPMIDSRKYLGKKIIIKFEHHSKEVYSFSGFITHIANNKGVRVTNSIILSGYSPTILLDQGSHCQSFEKLSLSNIIQKATQNFPKDLVEFKLKPNYTNEIPYSVQYKESYFEYIKRLAIRHGEWLYFNGREIVLGRVSEDIITLDEVADMFEYTLNMRLVPQNFAYLAYDANAAKDINEATNRATKPNISNEFVQDGITFSEKFYQEIPTTHFNHSLFDNPNDLRDVVQLQKSKRANVFYLSGKSTKPDLRVGLLIKVAAYLEGNYQKLVPLETYRIISIKKQYNGHGLYENSFEAVPHEITVPDYMNEDAVPTCQTQSAVVVDNNDPSGMSRIRVQFPWQKQMGEKSPWLRVVTPYAGGGKGQHILPEIGEEVLVGFENDNAEKPFVHGAMYHGEGKSGHGGEGNNFKAFETRSGHYLEFEELKNITLGDKKGNKFHIDSTGSTINITALETINLMAKNINLNASESITHSAGANITSKAGKDMTDTAGAMINQVANADYSLTAKNISKTASEKYSYDSKDIHRNASESINSSSAGEHKQNSDKTIKNQSGEEGHNA
jgi:type VI secretion system secreted protein VgrG